MCFCLYSTDLSYSAYHKDYIFMISPFYNEPVNIEKHSQKENSSNSKSNSIPSTEVFKIITELCQMQICVTCIRIEFCISVLPFNFGTFNSPVIMRLNILKLFFKKKIVWREINFWKASFYSYSIQKVEIIEIHDSFQVYCIIFFRVSLFQFQTYFFIQGDSFQTEWKII